MKVQIENNLFIESDSMQYTIKEYTGKVSKDEKTGKVTELYNAHGYYPTLSGAVRKIVRMKLHESTATTLGALLQDVQRIEEYIDSKISV